MEGSNKNQKNENQIQIKEIDVKKISIENYKTIEDLKKVNSKNFSKVIEKITSRILKNDKFLLKSTGVKFPDKEKKNLVEMLEAFK